MSERTHGFETMQIHAGAAPDPSTGARQIPIYQNTAYVFRDVDHAAALFNLQELGYIYSRLTNPTVSALQERVAALEGGVGAVACSSGHAAQIMALFPLMAPGRNVVASTRLYGGTVTQFSQTIKRFGWSAKFVDFDDEAAVAAAIDDDAPRLSVVPPDDDPSKTFDFSDGGQGALWNEPEPADTDPDETTPLLKRAFPVVRDD